MSVRAIGGTAAAALLSLAAAVATTGPAAAAPTAPRAYIGGHPVGNLTAGFTSYFANFGMVRTKPGTYDAIGVDATGVNFDYFKKSASAATFQGGAIQGASQGGLGVAIARSPDETTSYAAAGVPCSDRDGGIYLLRKSASAARFPAVRARDRVIADPVTGSRNCDSWGVHGIASLPGGRVAVLAEDRANGLQLLVGTPGKPFAAWPLQFAPVTSSFVTRDPDTGELTIASMGRSDVNGQPSPTLHYVTWTYGTDHTLSGPTVLPARVQSDRSQVDSLTAAAGQVWVAIQQGSPDQGGSHPGISGAAAPRNGAYVIHRDRQRHWGYAYIPAADRGGSNLRLAAVPKTGVLQATFSGASPGSLFHVKRQTDGHWLPAQPLPRDRFVIGMLSTPAGGYRYAYFNE